MGSLKTILIAVALVVGSTGMAQEDTMKPVFEKQGELIKGTFFHEDGTVEQTGTFKNRQLHGKWVAYDLAGKKIAEGNYENGKKTGKWFFWSGEKLTEVDYNQNIIAAVNTRMPDGLALENE